MLKNKKQSLAKKAVYVDEDVYVDVYVDDDDDNIVVIVIVVMVMKRRMNTRKNLRAKNKRQRRQNDYENCHWEQSTAPNTKTT